MNTVTAKEMLTVMGDAEIDRMNVNRRAMADAIGYAGGLMLLKVTPERVDDVLRMVQDRNDEGYSAEYEQAFLGAWQEIHRMMR